MPEELGINAIAFADAGLLSKNVEMGSTIADDYKIRASAGLGVSWLSPFGPVKVYLSKPFMKENYDKVEIFRFSFGTTY